MVHHVYEHGDDFDEHDDEHVMVQVEVEVILVDEMDDEPEVLIMVERIKRMGDCILLMDMLP